MNLDDYRGRLLARAFHDELEKLAAPPGGSATAMEIAKKLLTKKNILGAGMLAGGIYLGTTGHKAVFGKTRQPAL